MSSLKRISIACAVLANAAWGMTACLPHNGRLGAGGAGDNGSVLASIGGINEKDKDRPFTYELVCGDVRVEGEAKADKDFVRFPGDKLKDGDECAMEIRLGKAEAEKLEFEWFGVKNGTVDVGLFYGSDLQKINKSKLSLTLYSLAAEILDNSFAVKVNVTLDLAEGQAMPPEASTKASLVCGETEKYPGDYKKEAGDKDASLLFQNLPVKALLGKTCASVAVLVDNVAAFEGATPEIKLDGVKKNDFLKFPDASDDTKRYTLKPVAVGGGDVDVDTTGGQCLKYVDNKCLDVKTSQEIGGDLPSESNVLLARVQGKKPEGQVVTLVASVSSQDIIGALNAKGFSVGDLNEALAAAENKKFSFFKDASDDELQLKDNFTLDWLQAKHLTKASSDDLKDLKILHIEKIFVHAMHQVSEEKLNAQALPAVWMSLVKATKDQTTVEFLVTGKTAFFTSTTAPSTEADKPVFFDFAKLATEMAAAPGTDRWKVYGFNDNGMAGAGCALSKQAYLTLPNGVWFEKLAELDLKNGAAAEGVLTQCEVSQTEWNQALSGFTATAEHYVWEWFEFKK